jgi:hypothetical protein
MIKNTFILGVYNSEIQQRLLKIGNKRSMKQLKEEALAMEVAMQHSTLIKSEKTQEEVYAVNTSKHEVSKENTKYTCKKCGYKHVRGECPAFGKSCHVCGGKNHFSIGCLYKNKVKKLDLLYYNDNASIESIYFNKFHSNNYVHSIKSDWEHTLVIKNKIVTFKIDSGADINVLPWRFFKNLDIGVQHLINTKIKFITYGGFELYSMGIINVECLSNNKLFNIEFVVANVLSSPILGLKTCLELGLIKRLHDITSLDNEKHIFINKNIDIFSGVGKMPFKYDLKLTDDSMPVVKRAQKIPFSLHPRLKNTLDELEKKGFVSKVDVPTDWVNNIVVVEKPNKSLRVCINPIHLNKYVKREHYSIPTYDDIVNNLSGKKYFTVIDMSDGFHQIELSEKSSYLCTFNTPFGRYKYNRLPFGLSSSPEVFQRETLKIFGDIRGVSVYFDDLIIAASNPEEHDHIMQNVIEKARKHGIKFNKEKLQYKQSQVKFLGLLFSENGLNPDPSKIRAISELKIPKNIKELQRFLGMVNFLNRFIPNLASKLNNLNILLRKDRDWLWGKEQQVAFDEIKQVICKAGTLSYFDFNKEIIIQSDASKDGLGCCLLQDNCVIAFASRSLTKTEYNYSMIEKEMLGIVFAVKKFHQYIYGHKNVVIYTDHKPLVTIVKKEIFKNTNRLQRMQLKLLKYSLNIKYLPGKEMLVADMLSRDYLCDENYNETDMTDVVHSLELSDYLPISKSKLELFKKHTIDDDILTSVIQFVNSGWPDNKNLLNTEIKNYYFKFRNNLNYKEGLLFVNDKLIVPLQLRSLMLEIIHGEAHFGIVKSKNRAREILYWPKMSSDIEIFVNNCKTCKKFSCNNVRNELIPSQLPALPFQQIALDICEWDGKSYLICEDYYSRYLDVIPIANKSISLISSKLKVIFATHGIPLRIRCDNSPFNSEEFKQFALSWGFSIETSSPRYPKANGLAEKGVGIAKQILKKVHEENKCLYKALLEYRTSQLAHIPFSPSQLLMGRNLRGHLPAGHKFLSPRTIPFNVLRKYHNKQMSNRESNYNPKHSKETLFKENDKIWIKNFNDNNWEEGIIVRKHPSPRSYIVKNKNNKCFRRNIVHLKRRFDGWVTPNSSNFQSSFDGSSVDSATPQSNENKIVTRYGRVINKPNRLSYG